MKRKQYRAPRNAAERIREAERAIYRLRESMKGPVENRVGYYGQQAREAIARWQQVIDRETA